MYLIVTMEMVKLLVQHSDVVHVVRVKPYIIMPSLKQISLKRSYIERESKF